MNITSITIKRPIKKNGGYDLIGYLLKTLPLLTGYLVFSGIFSAMGYFYVFRINILWYISFSEAVLLFLDDVIFVGGKFFVVIAGLFPVIRWLFRLIFKWRRGNLDMTLLVGFTFLLLVESVLGIWYCNTLEVYRKSNSLFLEQYLRYVAAFIVMYCIGWGYKKRIMEMSMSSRYMILVTLLFTMVISFVSIHKAVQYKYAPTDTYTLFTWKDSSKPLCTSGALIFVGKVEKYYFLYDTVQKNAEVIVADNVKEIKWIDTSRVPTHN